MHRVYAYLIKQRFIAPEVITHFAKSNTHFTRIKNITMPYLSGLKKTASLNRHISGQQTALEVTFHITCGGSDTRYSFAHFERMNDFMSLKLLLIC